MTNEIAEANANKAMAETGGPAFGPGFQSDEIDTPKLVLIQSSTSSEVKGNSEPGTFRNKTTGESVKEFEFQVVGWQRKYSLYDDNPGKPNWQKTIKIDGPGKTSDPDLIGRRWRSEGGLKPNAVKAIEYYLLVNGEGVKIDFATNSRSWAAAKRLNAMFNASEHMWDKVFKMTAPLTPNPKFGNSTFVANVSMVRDATEDEVGFAENFANGLNLYYEAE